MKAHMAFLTCHLVDADMVLGDVVLWFRMFGPLHHR